MAAIDDVFDEWTTLIATISDALIKAEATFALTRYKDALTKQAALENNEVLSYTIAGRSVTRRDPGAGQSVIATLRVELHRSVFGNVSLGDMNTQTLIPSESP